MKHAALTVLIALGFASAALAGERITAEDLTPLYGNDLRQAFNGVTMHGTYKAERERTGTSNFTETFHTDGTTTYREGPITDKGEWTVTDKTICFAYSGALSGGVSCFNVFKAGNCYYSYGTGRLRGGYPLLPNAWSAKTLTEGEHTTCDDLIS